MKKILLAVMVLSAVLLAGGCKKTDTSVNGLTQDEIAGKWSVYEIYNLYFTESWDNIEAELGLDYMYAVFDKDYTYKGKFGADTFSGTYTINGWNLLVTAEKDNPQPEENKITKITYSMSDVEWDKENGYWKVQTDINFEEGEDGTMTVKMKKI